MILTNKANSHSYNKLLFTVILLCLIHGHINAQFVQSYDMQPVRPEAQSPVFSFNSSHFPPANPVSYSVNLELINIFALILSGSADHDPSFSRFREAFKAPPVWDDDKWYINYLAHPLMGSETYLRAREAGYGRLGSFAFSTAMSVVWEFLIESWTEPPSRQDLLVTSTTGSLLGEGRYWLKQKVDPGYYWLIDPLNMVRASFLRVKNHPSKRMVVLSTSLTF